MNLIEKLIYLKNNEYIVNSKFYVNLHLPFTHGNDWENDFDLIFFADSGTIVYKKHIQDLIFDIQIIDKEKVAYITWKK